MKYVQPKEITKTTTFDSITYSKAFYQIPYNYLNITDEIYPSWDISTTYNEGDYVILDDLKTIYRATTQNSGNFPINSDMWADYGSINSFRLSEMDRNIGNQTTGTDIVLEYDFSYCDTVAGVNLEFIEATVELINNDTNQVVFTKTVNSADIGCYSYGTYYYQEIRRKKRFMQTELPYLSDSTLRITFNGEAKIGTIVYGKYEDLGVSLQGTSIEWQSSSKVKVDEITGFREILRYGKVRELNVDVYFTTLDFNEIALKVDEIIDRNVLWLPTEEDKFSELISLGYLENFEIPFDNSVVYFTTARIIGVI